MSARKFRTSWWVDLRDPRGLRYRLRSPENSKAGALAYEALLRRELALHGSIQHLKEKKESQKPTLSVFAARWMREYVRTNNKPSEYRSKERMLRVHLLPYFGQSLLNEIDASMIERYKQLKVEEGIHPKTINNQLTVLHRCLVVAVEWGENIQIPHMRFLKVPAPKFRFLSEKDIQRLLTHSQSELWRTVILLAVRTGLRYSELAGLRWCDVDLRARQLCVRQAFVEKHMGTPKNGRTRYVPIAQDAYDALSVLPKDAEFVFHMGQGKPIIYETAYSILERICKRANLPRISWHVLRHTFASHLVARGGSLQAIQELLGHATLSMTLRYAHLAPSALHSTIRLLDQREDEKSFLGNGWATAPSVEEEVWLSSSTNTELKTPVPNEKHHVCA